MWIDKKQLWSKSATVCVWYFNITHKTQRVVKKVVKSSKKCRFDYFGLSIWLLSTSHFFPCHLTSFWLLFRQVFDKFVKQGLTVIIWQVFDGMSTSCWQVFFLEGRQKSVTSTVFGRVFDQLLTREFFRVVKNYVISSPSKRRFRPVKNLSIWQLFDNFFLPKFLCVGIPGYSQSVVWWFDSDWGSTCQAMPHLLRGWDKYKRHWSWGIPPCVNGQIHIQIAPHSLSYFPGPRGLLLQNHLWIRWQTSCNTDYTYIAKV